MQPPNTARQRFFDNQVHLKSWKDSMSGKNENAVLTALKFNGYEFGTDFVRQHPIGVRFVLDFAFVKEKIAIEIDGQSHKRPEQRKLDKARDRFCYANDWVVIRIPEDKFFGSSGSFYRHLIREVVDERRKQYESGRLYKIDIEDYVKEDYE